ncbi:MAG: aminodeoxychorismate synthase component I [Candidatus Binatia bacterium]
MSAPAPLPDAVPWRFFEAHRDRPSPFFIDRGLEDRPSFAGSRPGRRLVVDAGGLVHTWSGGAWRREAGDPLDRIADFVEQARSRPAALPAWLGNEALPRTVGFLAYELGAWADGPAAWADGPAGRHTAARGRIGTPLAVLSNYDEIDAWDPSGLRSARVRFTATPARETPPPLPAASPSSWSSTSREAYRRGFDRIREAIATGDIYQANLSRRAVFDLAENPADAYARLRRVQPVPWGAFLDFGGFALLSNSPECFLVRRGDRLITRPIKGTRPRRADPALDAGERASLVADPKEMAEHLMIVDLERSDFGRVARTGSVAVGRFATVESFATVHHMVSEVSAVLRQGTGLAALLRATFPGGSITGAPKIRAMEILGEVEDGERGPYTGAVGFFNGQEEVELSIAIRTAVAGGAKLLYSAGGGIVADSDPDREWEETELKIAALVAALAAAPRSTEAPAPTRAKAKANG